MRPTPVLLFPLKQFPTKQLLVSRYNTLVKQHGHKPFTQIHHSKHPKTTLLQNRYFGNISIPSVDSLQSSTLKESVNNKSTLEANAPPILQTESDESSKSKDKKKAKHSVPRNILRFLGKLIEYCIYAGLFLYSVQFAAYRADDKYALRCFGTAGPIVEKVLLAIRTSNESGNPTGFIPIVSTKQSMYNLLFEVNGHIQMQYLIHAYHLNDNAEYYSNNILGMYQANRISQRMDLMNEYLHLLISAALQLGYLTPSDYEKFEKTGIWNLPNIYKPTNSNSGSNSGLNPNHGKAWYQLW